MTDAEKQIRNEALEEAARVADDFHKNNQALPMGERKRYGVRDLQLYSRAATQLVAQDIRALKEKD